MEIVEFVAPAVIAIAFMGGDMLTGFCQALANKDVSSEKMRTGLWHKASFLIVLALAFGLEWASGYLPLGFQVPLFTPACVIVVLTEVVSILENVAKMNPSLAGSKLMELFRSSETAKADGAEKKGE